jgi:small redox-active disulfide protein 2
MKIKILGTGCMKCQKLEKETIDALAELGVIADVEKVTELDKIMEHDVMMTPGLVVNEKVKAFGRVPRREEIKKWIEEEL